MSAASEGPDQTARMRRLIWAFAVRICPDTFLLGEAHISAVKTIVNEIRRTEELLRRSPVSILYKSIAGRYRPVRVADGPITARYRFIKNASWEYLMTILREFFLVLHKSVLWVLIRSASVRRTALLMSTYNICFMKK